VEQLSGPHTGSMAKHTQRTTAGDGAELCRDPFSETQE
jgi:hypothetical protein